MERTYKNRKKSILIIAIVCVILVALVVYLQVRIKNVKADEIAKYEAQIAELTQERDEMQAAFDAMNYKENLDAMKDEIKALKDEKVELLATPEPTPEPTAEPTPEPTAEPTVAPTAKPTAAPTAKPTATPTAKPTAAPQG